jgi:hypothetical protein
MSKNVITLLISIGLAGFIVIFVNYYLELEWYWNTLLFIKFTGAFYIQLVWKVRGDER